MNTPTPPPTPQTAMPAQNVLSYAGNQVFERAVFRLIGWISIVMAVLLIGSLFADVLHLPGKRLPEWCLVLVGEGKSYWYYYGGVSYGAFYFSVGVSPITSKLLALPLLAGGIGCLGRYARTRAWMLLYAIPQLILSLCQLGIELYRQLSMRLLPSSELHTSVSESLLQLASAIPLLAWPTMIIYLMTRPYVARLYEKQTY
jgi:hypothetical protein